LGFRLDSVRLRVRRGIAPVGNIGNLGRRKGDDFIVVITAEKYVEIMKITAGSTEDGCALQGFSLTRIFALVLSMLSLGMGGRL